MQPRQMIQRLMNNISTVIVGKQEVIEYALIALLCRGHVLIEDVPGVGKTTLASALAKSLDCTFRRIQFTPDLMPSDVTGYTLVNFKTGETEYREGSVMSPLSCWRRRIRANLWAHIPCRKRKWIAFSCACPSATRRLSRRWTCWNAILAW